MVLSVILIIQYCDKNITNLTFLCLGMDTKTYSDTSESTEEDEKGLENDNAKKKRVVFVGNSRNSGGKGVVRCQAQGCEVDLTEGKSYHRRHKVCELHAKAEAVIVAGLRQRFCQQCSRFHELCEFDYTKRSCRRRLAGHNERRRKSSAESPREGSSTHRLVNQNNNYHGQNQNDETNIENHYYK